MQGLLTFNFQVMFLLLFESPTTILLLLFYSLYLIGMFFLLVSFYQLLPFLLFFLKSLHIFGSFNNLLLLKFHKMFFPFRFFFFKFADQKAGVCVQRW